MKKTRIIGIIPLLVTVIIIGTFSMTACEEDDGGWKASYAVGDTGPGGGKIFYVADGQDGRPLGFTVQMVNPDDNYTAYYLESAPTNASDSTVWGATGTYINGVTLVPANASFSSEAREIGNGRRDTQLIVSHMNENSITGTAAQVCIAYRGPNNKDDWFLPSLGELNLYKNSIGIYPGNNHEPIGNFWSSSQRNWNYESYVVMFYSGLGYIGHSRGTTNSVRAIRAF